MSAGASAGVLGAGSSRAEFAARLKSVLAEPHSNENRVAAVAESADARTPLIIEEADPAQFALAFARAADSGRPVFLADPNWGSNERRQLEALLRTGSEPASSLSPFGADRGWLMIPSGGTSGALKFARHDERTIAAAVVGFCEHFGAARVSAVGVLPLHHVSGFMAWMRCALTGGHFQPWPWKALESGERPPPLPGGSFRCLSLVPTQLQRLLASTGIAAWLRDFDAVFLGGGPAWPALLDAAAAARIPLSPGYGMTETAAMAAGLLPSEFLSGARSSGTPLPHIKAEISGEGTVMLSGASLFLGYYPGWRTDTVFATEDLGSIDDRGHLHLLGRRDAVIITGGKKVDPAEVEAVLRAPGTFADVVVIGIPDPEWGQAVVACYPQQENPPSLEQMALSLSALAPHKRPRRLIPIASWPRNAQGKLNRSLIVELAAAAASLNSK